MSTANKRNELSAHYISINIFTAASHSFRATARLSGRLLFFKNSYLAKL